MALSAANLRGLQERDAARENLDGLVAAFGGDAVEPPPPIHDRRTLVAGAHRAQRSHQRIPSSGEPRRDHRQRTRTRRATEAAAGAHVAPRTRSTRCSPVAVCTALDGFGRVLAGLDDGSARPCLSGRFACSARESGERGTEESNLEQGFWRPPCYRYTSPPRARDCRPSATIAGAAVHEDAHRPQPGPPSGRSTEPPVAADPAPAPVTTVR
jgi:hypothetical protein